MKWLILPVLMILSFNIKASVWKEGDVLLLPLRCYSCTVIESETGAPYSHSGVLFKVNGKWRVAQSLGEVNTLSLREFKKMGRGGEHILHLRPKHIKKSFYSMEYVFKKYYEGLPFDSRYLWNNFNEDGEELLYCSEFVLKFLNHFLSKKIVPNQMDFSENWDFWYEQWDGNVPQGQPGISPADFYYSKDFKVIRKINL